MDNKQELFRQTLAKLKGEFVAEQEKPRVAQKVPSEPQLHPGVWVEFYSPLFGMVAARIKSVETDGIWLTNHSVLMEARLSWGWQVSSIT